MQLDHADGQTDRRWETHDVANIRLYCTMTNKSTIISQIIPFISHVSTLSCHLRGARN